MGCCQYVKVASMMQDNVAMNPQKMCAASAHGKRRSHKLSMTVFSIKLSLLYRYQFSKECRTVRYHAAKLPGISPSRQSPRSSTLDFGSLPAGIKGFSPLPVSGLTSSPGPLRCRHPKSLQYLRS